MLSVASFAVLGPLLLAGLVFIVSGVRGRRDPSEPRCGSCRADLRDDLLAGRPRCSGCNADLGDRRAVRFGRGRRQPVRIGLGFAMLLLPVIVVAGLITSQQQVRAARQAAIARAAAGPGAAFLGQPVDALVAAFADETQWAFLWAVIQQRHSSGSLSDAELEALFEAAAEAIESTPSASAVARGAAPAMDRLMLERVSRGMLRDIGTDRSRPRSLRAAAGRLAVPMIQVSRSSPEMVSVGSPFPDPERAVQVVREVRLVLEDGTEQVLEPADGAARSPGASAEGAQRLTDLLGLRELGSMPRFFRLPLDTIPDGRHRIRVTLEELVFPDEPLLKDSTGRVAPIELWPDGALRRVHEVETALVLPAPPPSPGRFGRPPAPGARP